MTTPRARSKLKMVATIAVTKLILTIHLLIMAQNKIVVSWDMFCWKMGSFQELKAFNKIFLLENPGWLNGHLGYNPR